MGDKDSDTYADDSYRNDVNLGCRVEILRSREAIRACFPPQISTPNFYNSIGYHNRMGKCGQGSIFAVDAGRIMIIEWQGGYGLATTSSNCVRYRGSIIEFQSSDSTRAEVCGPGCCRHWSLDGLLNLPLATSALQQGSVWLRSSCPKRKQIIIDSAPWSLISILVSTFSHLTNIVKLAIHSAGYTHFEGSASFPRTVTSDPETGLLIPKVALADLRKDLRNIYPELGEKPFRSTRLCWYNDTPDGNWIIGRHPANPSLILATGDSGHVYKFLPVIGHLVADIMENKLSTELVNKFANGRLVDRSRSGYPVELDLDQLCGVQGMYP